MKSVVAEKIGLKYQPVAVVLTDDKPEKARQFKPGKWACVMTMLALAAKGETAVFDRETYGCFGGGTGLGFGRCFKYSPGGEECFRYFLSTGNMQWEQGRQTAEHVKPFMTAESYDNFVHGERYLKTPELVLKFMENLPIMDVPTQFIVYKPLKDVMPEREKPEVVVFLGDMDQISALTILANYGRENSQNVISPFAAGCQSIGILPYNESKSEQPRAVLGLFDLSARVTMKRQLKDDVMTFAAPYKLFLEMEENVPGSFLERHTWQELQSLRS